MLRLQNGINVDDVDNANGDDDRNAESGDDCARDFMVQGMLEGLRTTPYVMGDLQVISLGKLSSEFHPCFMRFGQLVNIAVPLSIILVFTHHLVKIF